MGAIVFLIIAALFPLTRDPLDNFVDDCTLALAYVVMALGLNIVVGFAGLLDLGYVAFYAFGAYTVGWFASDHFALINGEKGVHVGVSEFASSLPGIHLNFLLVLLAAAIICAIVGMVIGLPTLRLRGDYIAIVTLAFGEIIYRFAVNGDQIKIAEGAKLTNGRQAISPIDAIDLPLLKEFDGALSLRPFYWFALVLVAVSCCWSTSACATRASGAPGSRSARTRSPRRRMGVPLVKTKLMAYATGAAFGGIAGAFLGAYLNSVNANNFQFGFSIFVLAMIILGGLGSIWGVVVGAITLSFINSYFIPDVFNTCRRRLGLDFDLTQLSFGIFGFLILHHDGPATRGPDPRATAQARAHRGHRRRRRHRWRSSQP